MKKIEVSFNGSVYIDPSKLKINWREVLGKDEFEAIYEHEVTEFLKDRITTNPKKLASMIRDGDVELAGLYVWPVYEDE